MPDDPRVIAFDRPWSPAGMSLDFARGRPTNPARIPTAGNDGRVIVSGGWYQ